MPRRQKKWKAGDGEAAASKNRVIQSMFRPSQYLTHTTLSLLLLSSPSVNSLLQSEEVLILLLD
ncbi:hypothetical protein DPMN_131097 [Dreissena polymorpha]|uniref:Uncharacterized protein n=1 Tax=Dreissena polymorpha TaxID=45954 RepID=A0A9D4H8Z4_DREPO|nr:hypothetical protein DPMN_131097 [Dreissena polymorpha]